MDTAPRTVPQFRESDPTLPQPTIPGLQAESRPVQSAAGTSTTPMLPERNDNTAVQAGASTLHELQGIQETPAHTTLENARSTLLSPVNTLDSLGNNVGNSDLNLHFHISSPGIGGALPSLRKGTEPTDADIKIGPIFLDAPYASAAVLATDNALLTARHREAGAIAIAQLGLRMIVQLTDTLEFTANGAVTYFPIKNQIGVSGDGAYVSGYGLRALAPIGSLAKLVWTTELASWPITVLDVFSQNAADFTFGTGGDFGYLTGNRFIDQDEIGRYVFRTPDRQDTTQVEANDPHLRTVDADSSFFQNLLRISTSKVLGGEVKVLASVFQENLFYNQDRRGLPDLRQGYFLQLSDTHEDLRFQPILSYEGTRNSYNDNFDQIILLTIRGPIDDQVRLLVEAGAFINADHNLENLIGRIDIQHDAGPFTTEEFSLGRELTYFHDALETFAFYRFHQVFGPRLSGNLFVRYSEDQDLLGQYGDTYGWRGGLEFQWTLGPKTSARLTALYARFHGAETEETWTARASVRYQFTDTFRGELLYEYQKHDEHGHVLIGPSFYENLAILQLTKSFH